MILAHPAMADIRLPFEEFLYQALAEYSQRIGQKLTPLLWKETTKKCLADWTAHRKVDSRRFKGNPAAERVYAYYPRKEGRKSALIAISGALASWSEEALTEAVKTYAAAVARWPAEERQFVPLAATWFNDQRYDDDPNEWLKRCKGPMPKIDPPLTLPPDWLRLMRENYPQWVGFVDGTPLDERLMSRGTKESIISALAQLRQ